MKEEKYKNLRRILEKLKQELGGEIYLQDINEFLGSGPYQKIQRAKKIQGKYSWVKIGRRPKNSKSLESKTEKIRNNISEEELDYSKIKEEYFSLCEKYREDLSRTDLNQGRKEFRELYEKIRLYEINQLKNKKIDFLSGRGKKEEINFK